jgi:hypothetical protein
LLGDAVDTREWLARKRKDFYLGLLAGAILMEDHQIERRARGEVKRLEREIWRRTHAA